MTATDEDNFAPRFIAKLVRGNVYYLGDMRLDRGALVVVEEHHVEHLKEHGSEPIADGEGEVTIKRSFVFRSYDGNEPVGTVVGWDDKLRRSENEDPSDVDKEARLRGFQAKEKARKERGGVLPPPAYRDPELSRREEGEFDGSEDEAELAVIQRPARTAVRDELTEAPAPRVRQRSTGA